MVALIDGPLSACITHIPPTQTRAAGRFGIQKRIRQERPRVTGEKNMNPIIEELEKEQLSENPPEFRTGDTVRVYGKIKEGNRERVQVFEGTVKKIQGGSSRTTFTVRKLSGGIGVEKTWPLHSPLIEKVEVVRRGKVRRAKLNYLKGLTGKKAKVKEVVR